MQVCPFCHTTLNDENTFCFVCGYLLASALPLPLFRHKRLYFFLAILSILLGILSCGFTFFPSLYMGSLILVLGAIGFAGVTLERVQGKSDVLLIKILAILGLFFGALGYIFFMFIHSNVPGIGYSM
jgi:hypothetical protein